jgi:uracil-DNA glycosylase
MTSESGRLLNDIFRCPNVEICLNLSEGDSHACKAIVDLQGSDYVALHDLPEPWMGRLGTAPILFIGSNPNAGADSAYPRWNDSDDSVVDYFDNHFGGGESVWVEDGVRPMNPDGTKGRVVRYWQGVRRRAAELMGVDESEVRPGVDYALTEVVHCKSGEEAGVTTASVKECGSRYFDRILEQSPARVVLVMGSAARRHIELQFGITVKTGDVWAQRANSFERSFVFLHHPTAWKTEAQVSLLSIGQRAVAELRKKI